MGTGATTDEERLRRVAEALADAASARAAGQRRRLPVVQPADVAGLVAMLHEQLEYVIDMRNSEATAAGAVIACGRGCNACCMLPVVVGEHEAVAIALWLTQPENAAVRERFLGGYQAWRGKLGDRIERVPTAVSPELERVAFEYFQQRAMCPFNTDEGTCSVYPVRPGVCRTTHALDTNEKCQGQSDTIDEIKHPAVESTIAGQQAMRAILHETQRPGAGSDIMPKAVMRHLAKATAFPNQPCPCGSGLKFKRCCGA